MGNKLASQYCAARKGKKVAEIAFSPQFLSLSEDEINLSGIAIVRVFSFEFQTPSASNGFRTIEFGIDGYVGDGFITTADFDSSEAGGGH